MAAVLGDGQGVSLSMGKGFRLGVGDGLSPSVRIIE
jgi:hypothetical protein